MAKRQRKKSSIIEDADTAHYKKKYSKFFYENGNPVPWVDFPTTNSSATWAQLLYEPMQKEQYVLDPKRPNKLKTVRTPSMERALLPYLVTFGVFYSEQATDAHKHYGIIYSPNGDAPLAQTAILKHWRSWVKNPMLISQGIPIESSISVYPLLSKLASVEVINDKEYNEIWQSVKKSGKYKAAGHPQDPNAVLIQDPTFDPYRGGDAFSGMKGLTEYG